MRDKSVIQLKYRSKRISTLKLAFHLEHGGSDEHKIGPGCVYFFRRSFSVKYPICPRALWLTQEAAECLGR